MSARIVVERVTFGRYRATRGAESVEWNAFEPLTQQALSSVSPYFNRALRDLELGLACRNCGYIEVEHHIDGDERAPCNDFVSAGTREPGRATEGTP